MKYIVLFLFFSVSTYSSGNSLESKKTLINLDIEKNYGVKFTLKNVSNEQISFNTYQLHRNHIFLSLGYGQGIPLSESWFPESPLYSTKKLLPGESIPFKIDLFRRFPKLKSMIEKKCIFLFWAIKLSYKEQLKKDIFSGSEILNESICSSKEKSNINNDFF